MNKIKIAAVLVIICIFSSLITSIVKAQDKITLSVNIAEIESNKDVIDLTDMKAELVIEEIIIETNTANSGLYCLSIITIIRATNPIIMILIMSIIFLPFFIN